jgi:hypothetical protein
MIGFINFGRDNSGARDEFVYAYSHDGPRADTPADRFVLMRAAKDRIMDRAAWQFFERLDDRQQPVWTADVKKRGGVFENPGACLRSAMTFCPGLKR